MLKINRETRRRRQTIERSETDTHRWTEANSFNDRWEYRSVFAAAHCADSSAVCDIGCGMQKLRKFLRPGTRYLPVDVKQWTEDTTVCDLNSGDFPTQAVAAADTVTMLGVLEYIYDVPSVLEKLAATRPKFVTSYNAVDLLERNREANGWVNAFTLGNFVAMIQAAGFMVCDVRMLEPGQALLLAKPA